MNIPLRLLVPLALLTAASAACAQLSAQPAPEAEASAPEHAIPETARESDVEAELGTARTISEPETIPQAPVSPSASDGPLPKTEELVFQALALQGVDYKYGGHSVETGFDCSGFVRHVFAEAAGVSLPHNASMMSRLGQPVRRAQLKPGDLVFFNTLKRAFSHVGIYIGDNRFVHAPSRGGAVRIESMTTRYWVKRFNGARRVLDEFLHADARASEGTAGR